MTGGRLNISFKFNWPGEGQSGVVVGNCDKKYNWLTALWISKNGGLGYGYAYEWDNIVRPVGTVEANRWYTYDAVIDLDEKYMNVTVLDDSGNTVGSGHGKMRGRVDKIDGDWNNWPIETNFKQIAAILPIKLDDMSVESYSVPVVTETEDTIRASAEVSGADSGSYQLLLAQYDKDGVLIGVDTKPAELDADKTASLELTAAKAGGADSYKALLWNSTNGLKPMSSAVKQDDIGKVYKVLAIGNSFCDDSVYYLHSVAAADGVALTAVNCYYGGRPLKTHAARMKGGEADYTIKEPAGGTKLSYSVQDALKFNDWDAVVLQGTTHMDACDTSLWDNVAADWTTMRDGVAALAPNAKRLVHMSWAPYAERAKDFVDKYGKFTLAEGENARTAYLNALIPHYKFGADIYSTTPGEMIPTAIAVEYILTHHGDRFKETEGEPTADGTSVLYPNEFGTHGMYRDNTCHMSVTGRVLASLVWYEMITGNSVLDNKYVGRGRTEEDMQILREAAHYACENYNALK